jgi:hypothetical protein
VESAYELAGWVGISWETVSPERFYQSLRLLNPSGFAVGFFFWKNVGFTGYSAMCGVISMIDIFACHVARLIDDSPEFEWDQEIAVRWGHVKQDWYKFNMEILAQGRFILKMQDENQQALSALIFDAMEGFTGGYSITGMARRGASALTSLIVKSKPKVQEQFIDYHNKLSGPNIQDGQIVLSEDNYDLIAQRDKEVRKQVKLTLQKQKTLTLGWKKPSAGETTEEQEQKPRKKESRAEDVD